MSSVAPTGDAVTGTRGTTVVAWSLCASCVALAAIALVLDLLTDPGVMHFYPEERPAPVVGYLMKVLVPAYPIVGALIVSRLPRHPVGWLFCGLGLLHAAGALLVAYADYALLVSFDLPYGELSAWLSGVLGWAPALALTTLLLLVFPSGRLPSRIWLIVAWAAVLGAVVETVGAALFPGNMYGHHHYVVNPFGVAGVLAGFTTYDLFTTAMVGGNSLLVICTLAGLLSLFLRLRHAPPIERQQLKWFVFAAVPASLSLCVQLVQLIILDVSTFYFGDTRELMSWDVFALARYVMTASTILFPTFTFIAILRYRLYDIDLVINRTLVYGALTACVVAIYVLAVGGLGTVLQARGDFGVSLLATGLVALMFQPLRSRLQRGVNRLMYGERDDPQAVISRLGKRLEATLAPGAVLPAVVETIAQALKLPHVEIRLQGRGGMRTVAAYGTPIGEGRAFPLVYGGEEIGQLVISARGQNEDLSAADLRLLEDLARHAEVAAQSVRLTTDLQHSRERLVSAREEERRRLRRDLHDGLGPTLASLALKLDAAGKLVRQRPDDAENLLRQARDQTQDTVGEVRRLVHGLRPQALDDLGLVAAIRQQAEGHGFAVEGSQPRGGQRMPVNGGAVRFELEVPEGLPPLPAAVEVAAFRIVQEALTNVARHARAGHCRVRLSVEGDVLAVEVTDDGVGLPDRRTSGVGRFSMRERAEELGGTCTLGPGPTGGTRVLARLPLIRPAETEEKEAPSRTAASASS